MSGAGLNGKVNGNANEENGIPLGTTSSTNPGHIKHKLSIASRLAQNSSSNSHPGSSRRNSKRLSMEEQNGEVDDASFDVLDNVTNVVQYAIVSLFEIIRMMTSEQKEYFLKEITNTSSKRYEFLSHLCQITHRMLTFSDAKQIFPSLWLVMCIGEHQTQLSILRWFSSMAADEFLFNEKEYRKEIALKLHLQNIETKKKNQKENQDQQEDEDDD